MNGTLRLEVLRFNPERDAEPHWQGWDVPWTHDTSLLQALLHVKDHLDGSLTLRWSCRMAVCGSCGVMVGGRPVLACSTFLRELAPGPVRVEPLANLAILRDLAVDQEGFLDKLESVRPWIVEDPALAPPPGQPHRQTPAQMARYEPYAQCINCLLCYAACPQVGLDERFTGPAALALLHRYNADSRDHGQAERAAVIDAESGVWGCTLVGECSAVCPKGVDPAHAINQNKVASTLRFFGLERGRQGRR